MSSQRQIDANRHNSENSPGPIDTSRTRYNATKHALLAAGVTELDNAAGYENTLEGLMQDYAPVGTAETFFVKSSALYMVRCERARRLEAEFIESQINPPRYERDPLADLDAYSRGAVLDEGFSASIRPGSMQYLVSHYQRYEIHFSNLLIKTLKEINLLQKMRKEERKPTHAAANLRARHDRAKGTPVPAVTEPPSVLPCRDESLAEAPVVDNSYAEESAAPRTDLEHETVPSTNVENVATPSGNVADVASGGVKKPAEPGVRPRRMGHFGADSEIRNEAKFLVRQKIGTSSDSKHLATFKASKQVLSVSLWKTPARLVCQAHCGRGGLAPRRGGEQVFVSAARRNDLC
jgi:hypothetical protein